jgi:hypothetical protein
MTLEQQLDAMGHPTASTLRGNNGVPDGVAALDALK